MVREVAHSEKLEEKLSPGLCLISCLNLFLQWLELMTLSLRRVVRRERTPLKLWNSSLRCTDTLLPCCWTHLTKLLYISEGPWYSAHIHGHMDTCSHTRIEIPTLHVTMYCKSSFINFVFCMKTTTVYFSVVQSHAVQYVLYVPFILLSELVHTVLCLMHLFFIFSRCWPIVAATGPLCSMCVRLCGTNSAESLS